MSSYIDPHKSGIKMKEKKKKMTCFYCAKRSIFVVDLSEITA